MDFFAVLAAVRLAGGGTAGLFALAPAWGAMEMLSRLSLFRINWIVLGQPLADLPLLAQVAALGGPEAASLLVLLVNAGLACLILWRGLPFEPPVWVRFSRGENAGVFPLAPGIRLGVMICLEDTLPDAAREYANEGATVLAALVNTADFAGTPEALQHLRRARLTAIAVGLPMLRAANSGISCAIDSRGRVPDTLEPGLPEAKVVSLPLDGRATPYRWWGDAGVLAFMAAMMLAIRYAALRMRPSAAARSAPRPASADRLNAYPTMSFGTTQVVSPQIRPNFATASLIDRYFSINGSIECSV